MRDYIRVLREHPNFRLLFSARAISLLGDWFSLIATFALLREVGLASPRAFGGVLVLYLLPITLAGPVAGVFADRFNRKTIMIATDVARSALALALLAAPLMPRPVVFVYVVIFVKVVASAFFEPARAAALPQLVPARDLAAANALGALIWSIVFTLGAALGGVVTDLAGWRVALVLDAATYAISALLVVRIALARRGRRPVARYDWMTLTGLRDLGDGLRFIVVRPAVATLISIKTGWGIAGAITLLLTLFGERVYALGGRPDLGIALLLMARALGTGIGPLVARRLVRDEAPRAMRRLLTISFVCPAIGYFAFSFVSNPFVAVGAVILAHCGGSVLWVYSTVLLQKTVPNEYLGRIMSTDLGLATLSISLSTWIYAELAASPGADLRWLVRVMALSLAVPAAVWWVASGRVARRL